MAKDFGDVKLHMVYKQELWWLTTSIIQDCEAVFEASYPPDNENECYIRVDYPLLAKINNILSESASLKKLISVPKNKSKNESARQFNLHVARANYLQGILKKVNIQEISSARLRNTLQHFDEYLDAACIKAEDGDLKKYEQAVYNMVLSDWRAFTPKPYPLRLYVCSERKYYNMDVSIDLSKIHSEATSIKTELERLINPNGDLSPGAFIILV